MSLCTEKGLETEEVIELGKRTYADVWIKAMWEILTNLNILYNKLLNHGCQAYSIKVV